MTTSKNRHLYFALAYSLAMLAGLNLTGMVGLWNDISGIFWLLGASGLLLYLPIVTLFPEPPFIAMTITVFVGNFAVAYLVIYAVDRFLTGPNRKANFWAVLAAAMLLTNFACLMIGWFAITLNAPAGSILDIRHRPKTASIAPHLSSADSSTATNPTPTSPTATVLERGDGRINGPQTCGTYSVNFLQPDENESQGTWALVQLSSKKALFHGDWAIGCTLVWSADCQHLAFSVAGGSNFEDLSVYDMKTASKFDPSSLVNLGLPTDADILHFYWRPKKWNGQGELVFRGWGNYMRKSEWKNGSARGYGVEGTWAYKPDGTVRTIALKAN